MNQGTGSIEGLIDWQPYEQLRNISSEAIKYSCGFLRCRPERWFPNLATQWVALAHSLGVDFRVVEVSPSLRAPDVGRSYRCAFEGEELGICFDRDAEALILQTIKLDSVHARSLIVEYVARRVFSSLAMSWNGPTQGQGPVFIGALAEKTNDFLEQQVGGIKIVFSIDGKLGAVWVSLGSALVEQLDGLWKRQVRSTSKLSKESTQIQIEVAQLGIPTEELPRYIVPGAVIELETPVSDYVTLRMSDKPWHLARLCIVGELFGLEIASRTAVDAPDSEGMQRVSIRLGDFTVDGNTLAEVAQPGSTMMTSVKADNLVKLYVSNQVVARARLQMYSGSFALTMLPSTE